MENGNQESLNSCALRNEYMRNSILDLAAQAFLECGYSDTTMSQLAKNVGGSKGTLWKYFSSKDMLFISSLSKYIIEYKEINLVDMGPLCDFEISLRKFCSDLLSRLSTNESIRLYRLVLGEVGRFPVIGRCYDLLYRDIRLILANFLDGAMGRGVISPGDPLMASQQLIALCTLGRYQLLIFGVIQCLSQDDILIESGQAVDIFLNSYSI